MKETKKETYKKVFQKRKKNDSWATKNKCKKISPEMKK